MKIALVSVAPPYRGGISTHSAILSEHLSESHSVKVFNFNRQYPDYLFPGKTQFFENDEFPSFESNRSIDSIGPGSWKITARQIIEFAPDLIIYRFWNPFFGLSMGSIAKLICKISPEIKQISLCDNIIPHESSFIDKWLTMRLFNQMDGFLVQSEGVRNELKNLLPNALVEKRFHPIYDNYGPSIEKNAARQKLGITAKHLILYFGIVREYKGVDVLIRAAQLLKEKVEDFYILAVGESYGDAEKYNSLITELEVGDVFTWENRFIPDSEVSAYFSASDVMALPYHSASQSGIVQIAYNYNLPVVVTDVGGLPEYVEKGVSGEIVKVNDPLELANCLANGLINGDFLNMSTNINDVKSKFSWTNFIEGIESLYSRI
ncbi:MAG: glycosyltransferase [Candidatus Marinimicrobia bacterium]|nr:glycosyltransferase [Candidatus Neomarinimicrobiota bacterium]